MDPRGNVLEDSDVLCANRLATVRVTRLSRLRRSAYPLASACCAPKARLQHRRRKCPWGTLPWKIEALSQPPAFRLQIRPVILSVPTFSPQLEQYNRVRGNSVLAHATDGPKSRKLHQCELVGPTHVSPPSPRIKKPDSKGRLWSPLACLSPISFFTQRKIWPTECVG